MPSEQISLSPQLSTQLGHVAHIVAQVCLVPKDRQSLATLLPQVPAGLRSGVQALSFAALRHVGHALVLIELLVDKRPQPAVHGLLAATLALLQTKDTGAAYSEFTLVNQTVEAAKSERKTEKAASFLNAVLRRYLRERERLDSEALKNEVAQFNHPQWWIDQVRADHPDRWQEILAANLTRPPLTLRVNTRYTAAPDYASLLATSGVACKVLQPTTQYIQGLQAVSLQHSVRVPELPHFEDGWFSVQDVAAQSTSLQLLSDEFLAQLKTKQASDGQVIRVLDACAAPGGKTTHLMERLLGAGLRAQVWAIELDEKRCTRINENLARLRLTSPDLVNQDLEVKVMVANAAKVSEWWDGVPFDAVLLDAPCSASGIVRRHPDIPWLRLKSDIATLGGLQLGLLVALWGVLAPKGRLLYATCSVFAQEGKGLVAQWLSREKTAVKRLDSHGLWLPSQNPEMSHDGFFDALFEKSC